MLASITPAQAAEQAIRNFNHDVKVEGGSCGSFTPGDLINAVLKVTGPARVLPIIERDTILIGNPNWQIVITLTPGEDHNPRFFGFEVGNYPLRYLVQASGAWWLETTEKVA